MLCCGCKKGVVSFLFCFCLLVVGVFIFTNAGLIIRAYIHKCMKWEFSWGDKVTSYNESVPLTALPSRGP